MANSTPSGAVKHRDSTEPESGQTVKMFFFLSSFFFLLSSFFFRRASSTLRGAEAVRGVPKEVQKQLEKLKVGHVLCQLPPQLIVDLLYTSVKLHTLLMLNSVLPQSPHLTSFHSSHSHLYMKTHFLFKLNTYIYPIRPCILGNSHGLKVIIHSDNPLFE